MSILASATVPAHSRLADIQTAEFPTVDPQLELGRRAQALVDGGAPTWTDIAAQLGVTEDEALTASIDYIAAETGWIRPARPAPVAPPQPGNPALCPPWCDRNHRDEAERSHEREMLDLTVAAGDALNEQRYANVILQTYECPELPGGIDPTTVHVSIGRPGATAIDFSKLDGRSQAEIRWTAAAAESGLFGGESLKLTPEQALQLGQALIEAAKLAGGQR